MRTLPIALLALIAGCGPSQLRIEAPILARCTTSGVTACGELTRDILLYMDGDTDAARQKLWQAGGRNPPEKLLAFAASLQELGASPGAEPYAESMLEISSLIELQAARAAEASVAAGGPKPAATSAPGAPGAPGARGPGSAAPPAPGSAAPGEGPSRPGAAPPPARIELRPALTADTDPARIDGGVATPGASPSKVPCGALHARDAKGAAFCVKAIEGPFVVTDLRMSAGCDNELFVAAGASTQPRWALLGTPASPLAVHGARLFVKPGEFLFVGAQAAAQAKISTDARCSVLWSGFRPYTGAAADAKQVPRDLGF
jgi:hypothetical protein